MRVVRRPERCNFSGHVNYNFKSVICRHALDDIKSSPSVMGGFRSLLFKSEMCFLSHF